MTASTRAAIAGLLAGALLLAGCTPAPTTRELRAEAQQVFDALVEDLSAVDPAVLRAVSVSPATEQTCAGEEEPGTQSALVATGTLSITAVDPQIRRIADDLGDGLDPDAWDRIHDVDDAGHQDAWASETGVTVTVTAAAPALVVAVFTPCVH